MAVIVSPTQTATLLVSHTHFKLRNLETEATVYKHREEQEVEEYLVGPTFSWVQSHILRRQDLYNYEL